MVHWGSCPFRTSVTVVDSQIGGRRIRSETGQSRRETVTQSQGPLRFSREGRPVARLRIQALAKGTSMQPERTFPARPGWIRHPDVTATDGARTDPTSPPR